MFYLAQDFKPLPEQLREDCETPVTLADVERLHISLAESQSQPCDFRRFEPKSLFRADFFELFVLVLF